MEISANSASHEGSDTTETKYSSNFKKLYKATNLVSQQERRELLLKQIKERRNLNIDAKRNLTNEPCDTPECMDFELFKNSKKSKKRNKHFYKYKLMLSEWLSEVPHDLEENWLVKLCPIGSRNLVVANNGVTKSYNRYCKQTDEFQSILPGGNSASTTQLTVIDCIYNSKTLTYFVLDVLIWKYCSLLHCDSDFRFYWLKTKFDEELQSENLSSQERRFNLVDYFPAQLPLIEQSLSMPFEKYHLDGVLFYHKYTHYSFGLTPLVGWLKPYMIPEMLHIPVDVSFVEKRPASYTNLHEYLTKVAVLRDNSKGKKEVSMDVAVDSHNSDVENSALNIQMDE